MYYALRLNSYCKCMELRYIGSGSKAYMDRAETIYFYQHFYNNIGWF